MPRARNISLVVTIARIFGSVACSLHTQARESRAAPRCRGWGLGPKHDLRGDWGQSTTFRPAQWCPDSEALANAHLECTPQV